MSTTTLEDQVSATPIESIYVNEAIYAPLLAEFAADLSGHVSEISEAIAEKNPGKTLNLAHKLRGAAATYGYPELAQAAGLIEDLIKDRATKDEALDFETLGKFEQKLEGLASRITLGIKVRRITGA